MIWIKRLFLTLITLVALLAVLVVSVFFYTYHSISTAPVADPGQALLSRADNQVSQPRGPAPWLIQARLDQHAEIDLAEFHNPAQRFGPWTRWWWPGNLVTTKELTREMQMFADIGLAGVEIQPFAISLSKQDLARKDWQVNGWDSPQFYKNIHTVLESAKRLGLEVDLNNGSGWPTGGPHVAHSDGMRQLVHSEVFVSGPESLTIELPKPRMPIATFVAGAVGLAGNTPMQTYLEESQELVAVVAAKVITNGRTWAPWDFHDVVKLDPATARVLTAANDNHTLRWDVPDGDWAITALWQMPGGELVAGGHAHPQPGYVVDHLNAPLMRANQRYLFRDKTRLAQEFGGPLRAIFNDSLEFRQERHWAIGQLEEFENRAGYDARPWLTALIEPGKDQMPFHALNISTLPAYDLGENGERFLEDWDQLTSDLFRERYFQTVYSWAEENQLAHRLQAYGGPMDIIRGAGESHIPEAEQLYAGGSEMFLKAVSSGAQIANKPIVSAESFIFMGRAFMTTPLKIKALADKAFAAGMNQLVYHGTAYQIENHGARGYPINDGWYPWQLGLLSTDFSENWNFWEHAGTLNRYIARNQYLLRKGNAEADVLLLYPGLGFPQGYTNPEEPFDQGQFEGEEPLEGTESTGTDAEKLGRGTRQMRSLWQAMRKLEQQGLTWAWVNEHALRSARFENGVLKAGGLQAQALQIQHVIAIAPDVAEKIAELYRGGLPIFIPDKAPQRQRGLKEHASGDARVQAAFSIIDASEYHPIAKVRFKHTDVKTLRRRMQNGEVLQFFSNPKDSPTTLKLQAPAEFSQALWLDAWNGVAIEAQPNAHGEISYSLPAYGATYLLLKKDRVAVTKHNPSSVEAFIALDRWSLNVPSSSYTNTQFDLEDWLNIEALRSSGGPGVYTTRFQLSTEQIAKIDSGQLLELRLNKLGGAAHISLNGKPVGHVLIPPYRAVLNTAARMGDNHLEVTLTSPRKNRLIGPITRQDSGWNAPDLVGTEARISAGLLGPIELRLLN